MFLPFSAFAVATSRAKALTSPRGIFNFSSVPTICSKLTMTPGRGQTETRSIKNSIASSRAHLGFMVIFAFKRVVGIANSRVHPGFYSDICFQALCWHGNASSRFGLRVYSDICS